MCVGAFAMTRLYQACRDTHCQNTTETIKKIGSIICDQNIAESNFEELKKFLDMSIDDIVTHQTFISPDNNYKVI